MATESATDFDLGPLSWVQGEIDQELTRGLESLAAYRATGKVRPSRKHARTHGAGGKEMTVQTTLSTPQGDQSFKQIYTKS